MTPAEAIHEGCLIRFDDPMTTMCALFGAVPIAVGFGRAARRGGRWASRSSAA
jgi:multidrug efflux pump subunit AcrB